MEPDAIAGALGSFLLIMVPFAIILIKEKFYDKKPVDKR